MKNSEYWAQRFIQLENAQNKQGSDALREIEDVYRQAQKQLETQILVWYQRFAKNNGITLSEARQWLKDNDLKEFKWDVWDYIKYGQDNALSGNWIKELENASAKYHISRLEALKIHTKQSLENLFSKQGLIISKTMGDIYKSGYYHTAYELQKGFNIGWDIAGIDEKQLEKILAKPWAVDGYNFSERIWNNKNKLIQDVHKEISQNIMLGADPQKAINNLAKKMNTSKYNAGRLVMTEEAYFSSLSQKEAFQELGVEQYEIVATLDSHTSEICRNLDGKHFPMTDYRAGETAPPFHVYCRSTTAPYFDDNFGIVGQRAARDEETGKTYYVPANMTYKEWEKKYVVKNNVANDNNSGIIKEGLAAHSLDSNGVPKHKKPEKDKNVDFNDIEEVMKALTTFEEKVVNDTIENACVITKDGEVYRCYGVKDRVFPDVDLGNKLCGAIVSHNHPKGESDYSFSNDDIELFIKYELEILRCIDEKYIYELTRNADDIDFVDNNVHTMTEENFRHSQVADMARIYKIGYRRWNNDGRGSKEGNK